MQYLALFIYALWVCPLNAETSEIQSMRVTSGTIELAKEPKHGYIFRWEGGDEFFDTSLNASLSNKTAFAVGIPGLKDIGFKLDNGREYLFSAASDLRLMQLAAEEFPGHKVSAQLFDGQGGQRLEIRVSGQTPVYRIDLKIQGRELVLWSMRIDRDVQNKAEPKE